MWKSCCVMWKSCEKVKFRKIQKKRPKETYCKRDSGTGVFLWIFWNFWAHLFLQNTSSGCFCRLLLRKILRILFWPTKFVYLASRQTVFLVKWRGFIYSFDVTFISEFLENGNVLFQPVKNFTGISSISGIMHMVWSSRATASDSFSCPSTACKSKVYSVTALLKRNPRSTKSTFLILPLCSAVPFYFW